MAGQWKISGMISRPMATQNLPVCFVQGHYLLTDPGIYLDLGANQGGSLWLHCWFLGGHVRDPTLLARLTLYHLTTIPIVYLKNIVVNVCTEKTNHVEITLPCLFTHPNFCILFGVILVTRNTDWTFFNLCGYSVNMLSWWVCLSISILPWDNNLTIAVLWRAIPQWLFVDSWCEPVKDLKLLCVDKTQTTPGR